jgi:NAD(P)-dependent dehydrogenase (short-subunit alcohol dehydrogenase family)
MRATHDWLKLDGKVCVVTGAGSGIGASISELLCQEGARVAMLDRDEVAVNKIADSLRQRGGDVLPIVCDISLPDNVSSAAEKVLADAKAKAEAAPKKITITCVKGKVTKKVTAIKPVCPTGYKKK